MKAKRSEPQTGKKKAEEEEEVEQREEEEVDEGEESPYDSEDGLDDDDEEDEEEDEDEDEDDDEEDEDEDEDEDDESDEFEDQGSSDEEVLLQQQAEEDDSEDEGDEEAAVANKIMAEAEKKVRTFSAKPKPGAKGASALQLEQMLHVDDLSSDDEDATGMNTIGRVPLHWYDEFDHIGYDVHGQKIMKRKGQDLIDMALARKDDPNFMRTIVDAYNGREVVLSDRDLEIIRRIQAGTVAHPEHDMYPDYIDYYSGIPENMPLNDDTEPKRRFVPSKWETMKIVRMANDIKEGRLKIGEPTDEKKPEVFMLWDDQEDEVLAESKRYRFHLPAPKIPLPTHAESYNPPEEYLLTEEEQKKMEEMDPKDRPYDFIPKKHDALRKVGAFPDFVKQRFERCLDLYLCPRTLKRRLNIDPQTLIPRLPSPRDLKPFPNALVMQYTGHTGAVRSIALDQSGEYLISGGEDGTVRMWQVDTGLLVQQWNFGAPVSRVAWNPNPQRALCAIATGNRLVFIATGTGNADVLAATEEALTAGGKELPILHSFDDDGTDDADEEGADAEEGKHKALRWRRLDPSKWASGQFPSHTRTGTAIGPRVVVSLNGAVANLSWHSKGDYIAAVTTDLSAKCVGIHRLSEKQSRYPFKKTPGRVQAVAFHPSRPFLFVGLQQHVKVYHLVEQKLVKKLLTGCKFVSCMDVHHSGDHVLVGSYDRRLVWFDMDLSSTPYKTLKYHTKALRDVRYHPRYPLMASASDDGSVHVFHCKISNDFTQNPVIVPLKILKGHGVVGGVGVLSIQFHPRQPWILSAGVDGLINLYQDI